MFHAAWANDAGPLDRPQLVVDNPTSPTVSTPTLSDDPETETPVLTPEELQTEVEQEQNALELLPREELEVLAESGERAAQVVLGVDYAKEATKLAFAPAAANDALSDAVHWYSQAASRGFPGAPSLDDAGIRFYPVRVMRAPHN